VDVLGEALVRTVLKRRKYEIDTSQGEKKDAREKEASSLPGNIAASALMEP